VAAWALSIRLKTFRFSALSHLNFFPTEVQFTPDSKALVYIIGEKGSQNLWMQPLDGSPGRQITQFQGDEIQFFLYSPDGKSLGVMRTHREADVVLLRDTGSTVH
jgi:Tol biopolymer transport system component